MSKTATYGYPVKRLSGGSIVSGSGSYSTYTNITYTTATNTFQSLGASWTSGTTTTPYVRFNDLMATVSEHDLRDFIIRHRDVIMEVIYFSGIRQKLPTGYKGELELPDGSVIHFDDGITGIDNLNGDRYYRTMCDIRSGIPLYIPSDCRLKIHLGDKAVIEADGMGNFVVDDSNVGILYKTPPEREFNPYLNASDLLEEFINFVRPHVESKRAFLNLPVELFINWLVLRAAEHDGDEVPRSVQVIGHPALLPPPKKMKPRCLRSGKFIPAARAALGIPFASKRDMFAYADAVGAF